MSTTSMSRVIEAIHRKGVKTVIRGSEVRCSCLNHPDPNRDRAGDSLSVEFKDGKVLLKCFKGCTTEDILRCLDLKPSDLFESKSGRSGKRVKKTKIVVGGEERTLHGTAADVANAIAWSLEDRGEIPKQRAPDFTWIYLNAKSSPEMAVFRWNIPNDKVVRQASYHDTGFGETGWLAAQKKEGRPLYRLPDVIRSNEVFVCEGEKAADSTVSLGRCGTTSAGGAGAASHSDWSTLEGKRIVILPDNDDTGEKYVNDVCNLIWKQTTSVQQIEIKRLKDIWPEIQIGDDIADWSEANDSADAETLRQRIESIKSEIRTRPDADHQDTADEAAVSTSPITLVYHDAWKAAEKPRPMRECIIEGLLRRGEVGNIIAATKAGKSWFALMLLICIATGRDWLGRRVARGGVLLIDNELHEETLENRISAVQFAMNIPLDARRERFEYVACRGNWITLEDLMSEIPKRYKPGSLNLICIDAKYRLFGNGLEENSNDDQTTFHNKIDQFAAIMDCPIVLVHHATKGDQSGKAVTDVGAGGGSQARTVDLHMVIRPHQQPELSVLDTGLRSFIPTESMTLRWEWPLWSVVSGVKPVLPKDVKDSERYSSMRSKVEKYLTSEWQSLAKLAERCSTKKDRNPFADIIDELQQEGQIEIDENYIPNNSKRLTTGVRMTSDKMTSDNCPESLSGRPNCTTNTTTATPSLEVSAVVVESAPPDLGQTASEMRPSRGLGPLTQKQL